MRESSGKPCRSTMAGSAPGWSITCKPPPGACTRWVVMWLAWPGAGMVPHFSLASPVRPVASALWCCESAVAGAHDLRVALHLAHRRSALHELRVSHDAALIVEHEHLEPGARQLARGSRDHLPADLLILVPPGFRCWRSLAVESLLKGEREVDLSAIPPLRRRIHGPGSRTATCCARHITSPE